MLTARQTWYRWRARLSAQLIFALLLLIVPVLAESQGDGYCWCAKNVTVHHVSQTECDAIGGTGYKTKQEALANALKGLSSSDAFHTISAAAANKFHTDQGYEYVKKFEDWISLPVGGDAAVHALDTCGSIPNTELHCDVVFLIAADGQVRKILFAPNNRYTQCVSKNFRTSGKAPKPPADSWPIQIRLIDGVRPRYKGGDAPFVIFNKF
jgi:hypothetical protein